MCQIWVSDDKSLKSYVMNIIARGTDMVNSTYGNALNFLKLVFLNCNPAPFPCIQRKNRWLENLESLSCIYNITVDENWTQVLRIVYLRKKTKHCRNKKKILPTSPWFICLNFGLIYKEIKVNIES